MKESRSYAWLAAAVLLIGMGVLAVVSISSDRPQAALPAADTPTSTLTPLPTDTRSLLTVRADALQTVQADRGTVTAAALPTQTYFFEQTMTAGPGATATAHARATDYAGAMLERDQVLSGLVPGPYPLSFPMPLFTEDQYREAMACDIPAEHRNRRLAQFRLADLPRDFSPQSTCDWAVLAAAYGYSASEEETDIPIEGHNAFYKTISENPAFLLKDWIWFGYLSVGGVVEAPPLVDQPLVAASLHYTFGGIGYEADATLSITNGDTTPSVTGTIYEYNGFVEEGQEPERNDSVSDTVDPALVQALGQALTDLVPVQESFAVIGCYDYYPNWSVQLTYADGTQLNLSTGGNLLVGGGPWQTNIDGHQYILYSSALPDAITALVADFDFPGGTTAAMACGPREELLTHAYPRFASPDP